MLVGFYITPDKDIRFSNANTTFAHITDEEQLKPSFVRYKRDDYTTKFYSKSVQEYMQAMDAKDC